MTTVRALAALGIGAVAFAPPAAADEATFVQQLRTKYAFLTEEQLAAEGPRICSILNSGVPASNAVAAVQDDLGVSVSAAGEIISLAVVEYDC